MSLEKAISAVLDSRLDDSKKSHALYLLCLFKQEKLSQSYIQPKAQIKNPPCDTYVYLIGNSEGYVKIGFSGNPEKRLAQLKTGCHSAVLLYKFIGTMQDEKHLHALFSNKKISNEWFSLSNQDIELIISFFENKKTARVQKQRLLTENRKGYTDLVNEALYGSLSKSGLRVSLRQVKSFMSCRTEIARELRARLIVERIINDNGDII